MIRIGIDTGGTFTDLVRLDDSGLTVHKVRSTPDDPARAILQGLSDLLRPSEEPEIVHGSTVATNAVLERKGARVALVTTSGFEDVLRIGRQTRSELYNFFVEEPRPLVEDGLVFGIGERLTAEGRIILDLDETALPDVIAKLRDGNAECVAVCLLHSYANPEHELRLKRILTKAGFSVCTSFEVLPEYREVERWSTTVVNAYVTPVMARYLGALESELGPAKLRIMQSNGGSISAARAKAAAVQTILSGPAAGALGAFAVGEASGYSRVITFDMGGTSTDVSLVNGSLGLTTESMVGDCPVRLPVIDIHTVGAGGGSIAYVDSGGALRVGPRSAGAWPGPVCYGEGTEMTVTDANLLLGRLDTDNFLGGRMKLHIDRTREFAREFAAKLNLSELELAHGIVRVANANMERALRVVSLQRGFDPRDFVLLAFGGAGGMHACEIAESLDIRTVIIPRYSGVLSALGMLLADVKKDYSQTILVEASALSEEDLRDRFEPILVRARADLASEGFDASHIVLECSLDMRYRGQAYEIIVPFNADFRSEFDVRHERQYGYSNPARATEVVNLRVQAIGGSRKPPLPKVGPAIPRSVESSSKRPAYFGGESYQASVYRWELLTPGMFGSGPAIMASGQSTAVIPPHYSFTVDETGAVIATRGESGRQSENRENLSAVSTL